MNVDLVRRTDPRDAEDRVRTGVHERYERVHHPVEEVERVGTPEGQGKRTLDRQVFGCELPNNDVQVRDNAERQGEREHLEQGVRQPSKEGSEQRCDRGLADPANGQRAERHTKL